MWVFVCLVCFVAHTHTQCTACNLKWNTLTVHIQQTASKTCTNWVYEWVCLCLYLLFLHAYYYVSCSHIEFANRNVAVLCQSEIKCCWFKKRHGIVAKCISNNCIYCMCAVYIFLIRFHIRVYHHMLFVARTQDGCIVVVVYILLLIRMHFSYYLFWNFAIWKCDSINEIQVYKHTHSVYTYKLWWKTQKQKQNLSFKHLRNEM